MRLFSNFDTSLEKKLLNDYKKSFGDDMVLSIHRSKRFYYSKITFPLILLFLFFLVSIYYVYTGTFGGKEIIIPAFWVGSFVFFVMMLTVIGKHRMNFTMDFLIVTPKEIIKYDQTGVLERSTENIPADKLKSMSIKKSGLLNSLFDIGSIVFMAEGNDEKGDIVMEHIDAVEQVEKKIKHVLRMDVF